MFDRTHFLVYLVLAFGLFCPAVLAQSAMTAAPPNSTQIVTGTATTDRIRIAAPSAVVQLRLEVYDDAGQKLLDTEQRGGNVLDWHLQGGTGERVADGAYLCVVTVKNLSGRLSQKLGLVTVSGGATKLRPAGIAELSPRQTQAVGPIEGEDEGLAVMTAENAQPVTVLANNGDEAQLARTRGALTFRVGDFFSGNDQEQMRLTEDGNLGIGTATPKAKLDVAGMISAREGFMFSNGSTLNVNDKGALTVTSANGNVVPNAAGTGTLNRLAKWTETGGSGTLGDSLLNESGGGIEVRPAAAGGPGVNPIILNPNNVAGFAQFQFYPVAGPNTNMSFTVVPKGTGAPNNRAQFSIFGTDLFADATNYEFASLRARGSDFVFGTGKSGTGQVRPLMLAAGFLNDNTTNNGQLYLATTGNVGIANTNPSAQLSVGPTTTYIAVDAETNSGGEAVLAKCLQVNTDCFALEGSAVAGDYAGFFVGGKGVFADSLDSGSPGVSVQALGSNAYAIQAESTAYRGGYVKSDSNSLFSLVVDTHDGPTQGTAGLDVRGPLRVEGDLEVDGSKAGYVVDIMQNLDSTALEPGDVVVIVGSSAPVLGQIPVVTVKKATGAYDTAVAGVVDQVWYAPDAATKTAYEAQENTARAAMDARNRARTEARASDAKTKPVEVPMPEMKITDEQGTLHALSDVTSAQPGNYVSVVTLGSYKMVKVDASFGAVHAGDLLTTSAHAGYAMKVTDKVAAIGAIIGKALGNLDKGTGAIPVLVMPK